jgi:hypothetical protein
MSQQNIEVVRAIHDDWLRGDMAIDKFDPEIAIVEVEDDSGSIGLRYRCSPAVHGELS